MYKYYYFFSLPMLLITNLLIFLNSSPFFMWMIMEMNLMCFMNIISIYKFLYSQILMNYFLIQSFNSYLFLFSTIMLNTNFFNNVMNFLIIMAMLSKMGIPPFHMWYLNMMKQLNWIIFYLNSSLQKFIPLYITYSYVNKINHYIFFFLILMFLSPMMSLKFFSMKIIMSFSSMIQMIWIINLMMFNEKMWLSFFIFYNFISLILILMFYSHNINYLYEMNSMKNNINTMFSMNLMIFSLASIPPFTGFMNKWMFMDNMNLTNSMYMLMMMMIFSIINLYFYSRIMILNSMIFQLNLNKNFKFINMTTNNNKLNYMINFSIFFIFLYELF
uniref:NADH dehydrogenase subunit 2 n=1 Tax=Exoristobia philippinensis TaxID=3081681 RepID=UPI002A82A4BE|nr:NADH dehydrogenase subunit 2 [Exoristobia philippinensis]WOE90347.1 NADH dehydrogenase subunit 2 [Exoristobia philippinensis]